MQDAWSVLAEAGVPVDAVRPRPVAFDAARVREAMRAIDDPIDAMRRDALFAWICAFRHHWPGAFAHSVADVARRFEPHLHAGDANRHLKLRRIAIENLSGIV